MHISLGPKLQLRYFRALKAFRSKMDTELMTAPIWPRCRTPPRS